MLCLCWQYSVTVQYQHLDLIQVVCNHFELFAVYSIGVLVCVTISNLKAHCRRKTDLVFKTNKYLLNSRNSLDPYNISYCMSICVHVPVSGRLLNAC